MSATLECTHVRRNGPCNQYIALYPLYHPDLELRAVASSPRQPSYGRRSCSVIGTLEVMDALCQERRML